MAGSQGLQGIDGGAGGGDGGVVGNAADQCRAPDAEAVGDGLGAFRGVYDQPPCLRRWRRRNGAGPRIPC